MAHMSPFGPVVIKHYYRGGILRYINRKTYLNLGRSRCRAEYETLALVRQIGVRAPLPVAFATRPTAFAFYHAWLVTKKIPGARILADLAQCAPSQAESALPDVAKQINRLIQHHVLHVDLHPGNILVDQKGRIHVLDFDQAKTSMHNKEKMTRYYRKRWSRSITRHQLPAFLEAGLIQKIGF